MHYKVVYQLCYHKPIVHLELSEDNQVEQVLHNNPNNIQRYNNKYHLIQKLDQGIDLLHPGVL